MNNEQFKDVLTQKGEELYRTMPWREDTRPYYVLVSELMLQQTQVSRVVPKFQEFISRFPNESALASAELAEVLKYWQGLGYNRRAKFLHESAKMIVNEMSGKFPVDEQDLLKLPGVGKNTAGAIAAYAFNRPSIFVETNVRTVYLHHFFNDKLDVHDKEIIELLETTIDVQNPRRFYQNVMDYGSWLKSSGVRNIANSRHYKKQPPLNGSVRQVRGQIIRELAGGELETRVLMERINADDRFEKALLGLQKDGLIIRADSILKLTK